MPPWHLSLLSAYNHLSIALVYPKATEENHCQLRLSIQNPDKGFEGERPEYKIDCDCRKPKPGLLLQAAKDFNIDLSQSIMIGDSDRDVEAGEAAGCKAVKIEQNMTGGIIGVLRNILNKWGIICLPDLTSDCGRTIRFD